MLAHQLRSLGLSVVVSPYRTADPTGFDLVVPGPGPGDPRRLDEPKMAAMRALVDRLLADRTPMLAVCLGHQILAGALGLPVRRKPSPYQGMQKTIECFGRSAVVGFYSTFAAVAPAARLDTAHGEVDVARDEETGDVYALRGETFAGVQFHPESVLSQDGIDLLGVLVAELLQRSSTSSSPSSTLA
jgi:phenazine biosynthesis protein phzE